MLSSWAALGTGASAGLTGRSTSGWPGWAYTGLGSEEKHARTHRESERERDNINCTIHTRGCTDTSQHTDHEANPQGTKCVHTLSHTEAHEHTATQRHSVGCRAVGGTSESINSHYSLNTGCSLNQAQLSSAQLSSAQLSAGQLCAAQNS